VQRILLALVFAGCGGKQTAPAPHPVASNAAPPETPAEPAAAEAASTEADTPTTRHIAQMERFADAMCECTDAACSKKVHADINAWNREHSGDRKEFTQDDYDHLADLARQMVGCDHR